MTYALIADNQVIEYPIEIGDIILRYPNTSFAVPFQAPDGYMLVKSTPHPTITYAENFQEGTPELIEGEWTQKWVVTPASPDQITARTDRQAQTVRADRGKRLTDSDWTQLNDVQCDKVAWTNYRQQLRDVPIQTGFPWNVEWPTPPT